MTDTRAAAWERLRNRQPIPEHLEGAERRDAARKRLAAFLADLAEALPEVDQAARQRGGWLCIIVGRVHLAIGIGDPDHVPDIVNLDRLMHDLADRLELYGEPPQDFLRAELRRLASAYRASRMWAKVEACRYVWRRYVEADTPIEQGVEVE